MKPTPTDKRDEKQDGCGESCPGCNVRTDIATFRTLFLEDHPETLATTVADFAPERIWIYLLSRAKELRADLEQRHTGEVAERSRPADTG